MTKLTKYSLSCCVQQSPDEPFEGEELPQMDRFPFGLPGCQLSYKHQQPSRGAGTRARRKTDEDGIEIQKETECSGCDCL